MKNKKPHHKEQGLLVIAKISSLLRTNKVLDILLQEWRLLLFVSF